MNQRDLDIDSRIDDLAVEAARTAVASYVGASRGTDAASLIRLAVSKLPATGPLRGKNRTIVIGLTHLLPSVSNSVSDYSVLADAVSSLRRRSGGS